MSVIILIFAFMNECIYVDTFLVFASGVCVCQCVCFQETEASLARSLSWAFCRPVKFQASERAVREMAIACVQLLLAKHRAYAEVSKVA